MTKEELSKHICDVLTSIQKDSGQPVPALSDKTIPLAELIEFDSLACVDAEVRLSERLGVDIEKLPFKSVKTGQEQSIREIVDYVSETYGAKLRGKS